MNNRKITNPILPGFYPDPSICRVMDDFYMVCSSFELYPGIPVFHSKDLANWEQLGFAMTMENDFHVEANVFSGGVMAPTIRYHKGIFYIINTNFCDRGNYIVTAKNPAGPWSKPYWLEDVPGIDASLFIDDDDKAYILGTGNVVKRLDGTMDRGIWVCAFDLEQMKLIGEISVIWDSALRNAASPEAPHLYHVKDYYYLVIAEGGTEHYHAVTVARSKKLTDWYEGNPANPVMSHRQFGFTCSIANVGHADLVDTPRGDWYAVVLASRTIDGQHKNMGRETYLCPVVWDRGWPVFSPNSGKIDWEYPADQYLPWTEQAPEPEFDDFDQDSLALYWNFWGTPYQDFWSIQNSRLLLTCLPRTLSDPLKPLRLQDITKSCDQCVSFIARRQCHIDFEAFTSIEFSPQNQETAGLAVMQASNHQYRVEMTKNEDDKVIRLVLVTTAMEMPPHMPGFTSETTTQILAEVPWDKNTAVLGIIAKGQHYDFYYGESKEDKKLLYQGADGRLINPEIVGGMVGTMVGMFASANGQDSQKKAAFLWFSYCGR